MVTTDYQVVQGGIFHIRDVTLFQWGNTCSARYKLHERAYTGRHVCCLRARSPRRLACTCIRAHTRPPGCHTSRTGSRRRRPGALSLFLPYPTITRSLYPDHADVPFSQNHSHVHRLQKCPATFPRDRFPDRSPTTPYTGSISALEIRAGTLNGRNGVVGVARHCWNFETTRPKG